MELKLNILEKSVTELQIQVKDDDFSFRHFIYDPNENYLGTISLISDKPQQYGLVNSEGRTILFSTKMKKFLGSQYFIKDKEGNTLGIVKKQGLGNKKFTMENIFSIILLCRNKNKHLEIQDSKNRKIAELEVVKNGIHFKIRDEVFDRLLLLGFFLSIVHNKLGGRNISDGFNPEMAFSD